MGHWWKIYLNHASDKIEVTLTQNGSADNEILNASVTGLKMYANSWFIDKSNSAWIVKLVGGEFLCCVSSVTVFHAVS